MITTLTNRATRQATLSSLCHKRFKLPTPTATCLMKRANSSESTSTVPPNEQQDIPEPTRKQLRSISMHAALPMIGFGLMDQTIMIHAGNAIDCTIGVTLGLSTLAAAAVGQTLANTGGILFGESLQHFFTSKMDLIPNSNLSAAQMSLASVQRAKVGGTLWGVILGCTLGLLNLLLIDTGRSSQLKMIHALNDGDESNEFAFEIDVHNLQDEEHDSVTSLTVRGPDVDGIMAALVTLLAEERLSLVELNAKSKTGNEGEQMFEDVFLVKRNGEPVPEDELNDLASKVWDTTQSPLNVPTLTAKLKDSESRVKVLEERVERLMAQIQKRQVTTRASKQD